MSAISAILPVKGLDGAKTRLAPVLTLEERRELTLWMAGRVLDVLRYSGVVRMVYVVTPDPVVADLARERLATPVQDPGRGLNAALGTARAVAVREGAEACLTVLGDLPLLTSADVRGLASALDEGRSVVIAPDRRHSGTNALLLRPPDALPFSFGKSSFRAHLAAAGSRSLPMGTYQSAGTGFDLDTPADLEELRARLAGADVPPELREASALPAVLRAERIARAGGLSDVSPATPCACCARG